jgi:hypothetical protein
LGNSASFSPVTAAGRLYLSVNDDVFTDNSGKWDVVVTVFTPTTTPAPPAITAGFDPTAVVVGQPATLLLAVTNPNLYDSLTGLAFSASLPAGLVVANPPNVGNTCGGTFTATAGSGSISLAGGTLGANQTCTIGVNLVGTAGSYSVQTSAISATESGAGNPSNTTNLTVGKANTNTVITGRNPIPSGVGQPLTVYFTVTAIGTGGGSPTGEVTVTDGMVSCTASMAAGSCQITPTSPGNRLIRASYGGDSNYFASESVEHWIEVWALPLIAVVFDPAVAPAEDFTTLRLTLSNPNIYPGGYTGLAVTQTLPAGVVVTSPPVITNTCGGAVAALARGSSIVVTSGALAPNALCVLEVSVAGQAEGFYSTNPVGFASAQTGAGASTAVATLSVLPPRSVAPTPPTSPASAAQSSVVVSPASVAADGTATATITVTLRTAAGTPVAGKRVLLASSRGAVDVIAAASGNTDASGVYTTTIRSRTPGVAAIKAYISPEGVYLVDASLTFQ